MTGVLRAILAPTVIAVLGACSSTQFVARKDVSRYKPLPRGASVAVVETVTELPPPIVVLGALEMTTRSEVEQPDAARAESLLKQQAAHYGCDALAELSRSSQAVRRAAGSQSTSKKSAATSERFLYEHLWRAYCVRTAGAPGGLEPADVARGAELPAKDDAPSLSLVPVAED